MVSEPLTFTLVTTLEPLKRCVLLYVKVMYSTGLGNIKGSNRQCLTLMKRPDGYINWFHSQTSSCHFHFHGLPNAGGGLSWLIDAVPGLYLHACICLYPSTLSSTASQLTLIRLHFAWFVSPSSLFWIKSCPFTPPRPSSLRCDTLGNTMHCKLISDRKPYTHMAHVDSNQKAIRTL